MKDNISKIYTVSLNNQNISSNDLTEKNLNSGWEIKTTDSVLDTESLIKKLEEYKKTSIDNITWPNTGTGDNPLGPNIAWPSIGDWAFPSTQPVWPNPLQSNLININVIQQIGDLLIVEVSIMNNPGIKRYFHKRQEITEEQYNKIILEGIITKMNMEDSITKKDKDNE